MWIFLNNSFLSIVADPISDCLLVRGRIKGDIERVFPDAEVVEGAGTDYRFRTFLPRVTVANALAYASSGMNYGNFKGSVKERERHDEYMKVWRVMESWQSRAEAKERATGKAAAKMTEDEQRATDTGFPQAFLAQAGAPERPPLANQEEMEGLLRQYLSQTADNYDAYLANELDSVTAQQNGLNIAQELTDVLMGKKDAGYTLIPWFSPDQLGQYVRREIEFNGTPEESVFSLVVALFGKLYAIIRKAQAEFRDIQDFLPELDFEITQYACIFLSLPIPAEPPTQEPKMPFTHCPTCDNPKGCARDQNCYKEELAKPDPPYVEESPTVEKAYEAMNAVMDTIAARRKSKPS